MWTIVLFLLAICLVCLWCRHKYSYWQRHSIPFMKPIWFIGNTGEALTLKKHYGLYMSDVYNDPKMSNEAVVGIFNFHQPALVIRNLDIIKSVMIKDFNYFANRNGRTDPHIDGMAANNLFFARDSVWREIRTKISPVFTSGKIKQMYPLMLEVSNTLSL